MKKIILIALLSLGFLSETIAQSFISQGSDTVINYWYAPGDVQIDNKIKSTSSTPVYLKWKIINSHFDAGWSITGFCDNMLCYPFSVALLQGASHVSSSYSNASWGDLHAFINGDNAANGTYGSVTVLVEDTVANYSRTLTFIARKWPTGVNNVTKSDDNVVLYPNPAKDDLNILFDGNDGVKTITVYNLIGKAVSVFRVTAGNSAKLRIDNIPSGIYFVRLQDAQGRTVATRKFTHQ